MSEQEKLQRGKRRTKIILITVTVLFIVLMLVVPLISVITSALKEGFKFYLQSITTEYVISALGVTLIATVIAVVVNTFSEYALHGCLRSSPSKASRCWRH